MGGGGAIQCALKNDLYKTVSAISPICSLHHSAFAKEMFANYLNNNEEELRPSKMRGVAFPKAKYGVIAAIIIIVVVNIIFYKDFLLSLIN